MTRLSALNMYYVLRKRNNDPKGGSGAVLSANATRSPEGTGLRGKTVSSSVPGGSASWVPEHEDNTSIPISEVVGAKLPP